jgi:23S rRNA (cytidine2498-2'-O)-methyltransferase
MTDAGGAPSLPRDCTAYLAAPGFVAELLAELGDVVAVHDRLVIAEGPARPAAWAQNRWFGPEEIAIASIKDAARALRARQRNWSLYAFQLHRRAALIAAALPPVSARKLVFPAPAPRAPLGSWTLLAPDRMLVAARCESPFPNGEAGFVEDRSGPPNRAYLKLWEALTWLGETPRPGQRCLDLGSSPGGWTWVIARLGAEVISVDKAALAPAVAALPGVEFRQGSAFALDPAAVGPVDWWFSDVVCYPVRLLQLAQRWLAEGRVARMVATIKFQGATDHATARAFAAIPGSELRHLSHNKHELTWMWRAPARL